VHLAKFVDHVGCIHAGVVSELLGDNLKSLSVAINDKLLLAFDGADMLAQMSAQLHLNSTTASDDGVGFYCAGHNHNGIIKRAGSLLNVLSSATSDDQGNSLGAYALSKHVESLVTELNLLKLTTLSHDGISQSMSSGLNLTTCGFCNALQILDGDTTSAEDVSVREVLGGKIADWQLRKHNLCARIDNNVELVVDDLPLGIDNFLEVVRVLKTDLSGVLLCL
jgi:hypothetical protein